MEAPLPIGAATVCEVALPRKLHALIADGSTPPGPVWQNEPKF